MNVPTSTPIERLSGWKTSDGTIFQTVHEAEKHQAKIDFHTWCNENICRGGEWSANMVANAIWEHWDVRVPAMAPPRVHRLAAPEAHAHPAATRCAGP